MFLSALEDFENKIESFTGNADKDPDSWISKLYKTMSGESDQHQVDPSRFYDLDQGQQFGAVEGLESPILDESWIVSDPSIDEGIYKLFLSSLYRL